MTFPFQNPGRRIAAFDDNEHSGAADGGQPQNTGPDPRDQRVAALEQRLGQLTQVLTGFANENKQTRAQQQAEAQRQREMQQAQGYVRDAEQKLRAAERKLAEAHEAGDAAAIASATASLSTIGAEHTAARMHAESIANRPAAQPQQQQPQQQQPQKIDDTNLRAWRKRNESWYGVDPEMTRAAYEIAREVEGEKVLEVGSEQYFKAVDARLRSKYGDRMPSQSSAAQMQTQRGSMSNAQPAQQHRIPQSVADGFRRMGIDVDNPDVAKQMRAARETAVRKGFLPETPAYGSVISR